MNRVTISVQPRPYDALIVRGLLGRTGVCLRDAFPESKRCYVVSVAPVRKRWGKQLLRSLSAAGWQAALVEMPNGERHKRLSTVELLAEKLVRLGADRGAVLVAFGGGVVGDVAGFVASVYMRGVEVVQIPTTVQAQLDAAIGGKTGVNLRSGKNLVGTFHQPRVVLIDPDLLATLPDRELRSGLYEALKCGVIGSSELFTRFERGSASARGRDPGEIEYLITESVKLKGSVVAADEREGGLRRVLNFGHTIGHALEAATSYRRFLHGEAVAWGMIAAANIAEKMQVCDHQTAQRIEQATLDQGPLPPVTVSPSSIVRLLKADKKTKDGVVHFVLPREIGKVEVVKNVPSKLVLEAVNAIRHMRGN